MMFSSMTIASSTTKPTDSVSAISDRLLRLKPSRYITENVPTTDMGNAIEAMTVAATLRRNRKITRTTRAAASMSVNCTSTTECLIDCARSYMTSRSIEAGSCWRRDGRSFRTSSTICTVFEPGCR